MFTDSHAHIEMTNFDSDRKEVIKRASDAGVNMILNIGSVEPGLDSLRRAIALAEEYDFIYIAIGIHPHDAKSASDDLYGALEEKASHPKVIGWGEIGLDYHYDYSPREIQRLVFRRQLAMAKKFKLPVIIHSREAEKDTLDILHQVWEPARMRGVMHCFTGTRQMAQECLKMDFLISFSGIITFKNADDLRQIALALPIDRILIETDSPFLAPLPYRGKRNEPAFVIEVAKIIASIKKLTMEDVAKTTSSSFRSLFTKCGTEQAR